MTWRRFNVLLNNLSGESNTAYLIKNEKEDAKKENKVMSTQEMAAILGT